MQLSLDKSCTKISNLTYLLRSIEVVDPNTDIYAHSKSQTLIHAKALIRFSNRYNATDDLNHKYGLLQKP